jgi:beta-lactamase regulating signal transducer with metallopeptidase domain
MLSIFTYLLQVNIALTLFYLLYTLLLKRDTFKHPENELSHILLHEQTHARQWHSIDIILIETLCLFSWWNPFVWLMKREMAMNLEYLADNGVLREGVDSRKYQYHLLQLTYHETVFR